MNAEIGAALIMADMTVPALRKRAATKTEPHQEDDKCLDLEAVELIERLLKIVRASLTGGDPRGAA